jgi:Ca2+-binding RTX toxin-like protein
VGTEVFSYLVSDNHGGSASAAVTVVVNPNVRGPVFTTVSGPDTAIAGQTLVYYAETLDTSDTISWSVVDESGGIVAEGDGNQFEYRPVTTGEQIVRVTATNSGSSESSAESMVLTISAVGVVDGDLYVAGTEDSDLLQIRPGGGGAIDVYRGRQRVGSFDGVTGQIIINAFGGDDMIDIAKQITTDTRIFGGDGNDVILGGSGRDTINGGAGSDIIYGGNGADLLIGAEAADIIFGGNGADSIDGGDGDDWLFGQNGKDSLDGGLGDDKLFGGRGNDLLISAEGDDFLMGGRGSDRIQRRR